MIAHELRVSEEYLLALAQVWEWERLVDEQLDSVIAEEAVEVALQPIYPLGGTKERPWGYEALARFPTAPGAPVGMWFRAAVASGRALPLELLCVRKATVAVEALPADTSLCVNASAVAAGELRAVVDPDLAARVIVDIPYAVVETPVWSDVHAGLRAWGMRAAIDDVAPEALRDLRAGLQPPYPTFVKVDVVAGLADNGAATRELEEAVSWARDNGITVIAERVQQPADLAIVEELGISLAQGYCLGAPPEPGRHRAAW